MDLAARLVKLFLQLLDAFDGLGMLAFPIAYFPAEIAPQLLQCLLQTLHGGTVAQETNGSGVSIGRSRSVAFIGPRYNQIDRLRPDQFACQSTQIDGLDEALQSQRLKLRHPFELLQRLVSHLPSAHIHRFFGLAWTVLIVNDWLACFRFGCDGHGRISVLVDYRAGTFRGLNLIGVAVFLNADHDAQGEAEAADQ